MRDTNLSYGVILVIISLIISIFCCIFRRLSIKHSYGESQLIRMYFYGMLDISIASIWIFIVYHQII